MLRLNNLAMQQAQTKLNDIRASIEEVSWQCQIIWVSEPISSLSFQSTRTIANCICSTDKNLNTTLNTIRKWKKLNIITSDNSRINSLVHCGVVMALESDEDRPIFFGHKDLPRLKGLGCKSESACNKKKHITIIIY